MPPIRPLALLLGAVASAAGAAPLPGESLDAMYRGAALGHPALCLEQLAQPLAYIAPDSRRADGDALCQSLAGVSRLGGGAETIRLSTNGNTAWFNEELTGPAGQAGSASGVLVLQDGRWLVTQYHLSLSASPAPASQLTGTVAPAAPAAAAAKAETPDAAEPAAKPCRKLRHKTNKVANC